MGVAGMETWLRNRVQSPDDIYSDFLPPDAQVCWHRIITLLQRAAERIREIERQIPRPPIQSYHATEQAIRDGETIDPRRIEREQLLQPIVDALRVAMRQ